MAAEPKRQIAISRMEILVLSGTIGWIPRRNSGERFHSYWSTSNPARQPQRRLRRSFYQPQ